MSYYRVRGRRWVKDPEDFQVGDLTPDDAFLLERLDPPDSCAYDVQFWAYHNARCDAWVANGARRWELG